MAVTDLRVKLMYEDWSPTKDEWVKAGGKPEVYDLLAQDGSGQNNLTLHLKAIDGVLEEILKRLDAIESKVGSGSVGGTVGGTVQVTGQLTLGA
jgi:hypothetical protein